mgnify:CR=1 FL=1
MKSKSCVVIDYGLGNTFSVINALKIIGAEPILSGEYEIIKNADRVILPGVGAFGRGIEKLKRNNINESLSEYLLKERPLLGICLGMQLLMDRSFEFGEFKGLGYIAGEVKKIVIENPSSNSNRVPLIGWYKTFFNNQVSSEFAKKIGRAINLKSFYYVHSYSVVSIKKEFQLAYVDHSCQSIVAAICKNNIIGVQFHPEKSGKDGLDLINQFINL